jgi:N-acetylmuramic acid 6-phosphate (MurNAc-6-P) etherase
MSELLQILGLEPAPLSTDYVENKRQFHLYSLLTEQRHPKTWNLSFVLQSDTVAGLRMLLSVDQDISARIRQLELNPALLTQAADAVAEAVISGHRIYIYGCGATGRLAKQMESTFWRPFWRGVQQHRCWEKVRARVGGNVEDALVGEMTGGDRALVSSLEGFEDLQLIGRLQLQDHGIRRGDVVICVTEGGETSSVIGTVLAALEPYGPAGEGTIAEARKNLYFICNNPVDVLLPFERSAAVLTNPSITNINLTTGPQSVTGSTRMQATTSETFVVGVILEQALSQILKPCLTPEEMCGFGFGAESSIAERLADFDDVRRAVEACIHELARFTGLETNTYRKHRFATYLAKEALITVFIDNTERSPTFRLYPLDKIEDEQRRCWVQVWTEAPDLRSAWHRFLGRPFHGLDPLLYGPAFETGVEDPYLREAALRSLRSAGNDQEFSYDFSFSAANIARRGPERGDLGVLVLINEEGRALEDPDSGARNFIKLFHERGGSAGILTVTAAADMEKLKHTIAPLLQAGDLWVPLVLDPAADPLGLRAQIALKMLLNAHSTAIMASLGRVIGNTMTSVSPSNLKLIGRATYLVLSHVNDILKELECHGRHGMASPISFAEANAVLIEAIDFVKSREMGQTAEVALSIIRIIEALGQGTNVSWEEAQRILETEGLASYLVRHNSALAKAGDIQGFAET